MFTPRRVFGYGDLVILPEQKNNCSGLSFQQETEMFQRYLRQEMEL
jgi:cobyric acid synthase